MRPLVSVEVEVSSKRLLGLPAVGVVPQVDLLVLDRPPQPFDEHVVESAAATIHRDRHTSLFQSAREGRRRELRSLIGIEDFWPCSRQRRIEGFDTEVSCQRVGEPPGKDVAAVEIHDRRQIEEAMLQRDVSDVACPDLIGLRNRHIPQ